MANYTMTAASEKQIYAIKKLIAEKEYILLIPANQIPKREASKIIDFLKNGNGEYLDFIAYIRKRGPKIPNLVGDGHLYDATER